ncbi:NPCBM-associated, NEW3 domain of alpha-galactosidase [uncultured archaeon]|nr:NPCBM-associated, NEW3 domain of alpha-galactosidase [uncultured archaeon]
MNKFNFILIIVSTLLVAQAASADYLVTETTTVYPGDTTYVYFVVNNTGFGQFLNDVSVRLEPKDNASAGAVTILNDVYSLGTIQNWGDQRTARFKIHVNPDAAEGDYFFNIFIYYRGQLLSGSTPTPIVTTELKDQVLTIKGNPVIVLLNSTLGIVAPMSVNNETLRFKNTGTGTVQNAVAEIDLTRGELKSSFSILGGGTQFSLGNLKPGDEADITFDMAVDISAAPGVYNIPITITSSNNYSSDNFAGLVVAGTTDFEMSYQETLGSFSINVANVGVNPASAVTVSLPNQKNFTIVGSSSSVLGSLNPGDYTSAIFQITKNPGAAGNILNVVIQYTDTSGIRHAIEKNLVVQLLSTGAQTGTRGSALYTTWLPVIVVIVLLILFWQRRKISAYLHKPGDNK